MPLVASPRHRPGYDFTVEDYLEVLDRFGIRYGVIAAASPWGDYNEYTIDSVERNPRLRGTVILHPEVDYEFDRMTAAGIVGVRLPWLGLDGIPDISSPGYRRLFRTIAGRGWHVHLHVEARHLPRLLPVLEDAGPELVIDHMGRPGPEDGIDGEAFRAIVAAVRRGRAWVKVSCAYRIGPRAEAYLKGFLDAVDPGRLFWASDCPFVGHEGEVSYEETIDWFAHRIDGDERRKLIFGENAYRFYFRGA
jgi:predicted TIM-barrel fold metal-dependent hydrolase